MTNFPTAQLAVLQIVLLVLMIGASFSIGMRVNLKLNKAPIFATFSFLLSVICLVLTSHYIPF